MSLTYKSVGSIGRSCDDERLRVWIYLQRQHRAWDAREKEMVAYKPVEMQGRVSAASMIGVTMRTRQVSRDVPNFGEVH
jgi:ParB family transcriptional regulator, chromosome partitioning protein